MLRNSAGAADIRPPYARRERRRHCFQQGGARRSSPRAGSVAVSEVDEESMLG